MDKKALTIDDIDAAVQFKVPVDPTHIFYTDFSHVRGNFKESTLYRHLKVSAKDPHILNANNTPVLVFLAGMYGSGKTSELHKLADELETPDGYLCVSCNVDIDLDVHNMDFVDILIFQLEQLSIKAGEKGVQLDASIIESFLNWFAECTKESKTSKKTEDSAEVSMETGFSIPGLISFLGKLKSSFVNNREYAETTRSILRKNFSDFKDKFNEFVGEVKMALQQKKVAKDILFIIDGIEKVQTAEMRKRIIIDDGQRLREIKTNMLITMPIELHHDAANMRNIEPVIVRFPFIKLYDKVTCCEIPEAFERFRTFIYKRVDKDLFTDEDLVNDIIRKGGGSPREVLRIIQHMVIELDDDATQLNRDALDKAITYLANIYASGLTQTEIEELKKLKDSGDGNIPYSECLGELLQKLIVMEYNDGTYKRVNPLIEQSELYKKYVG
jgi:hypothetical protein